MNGHGIILLKNERSTELNKNEWHFADYLKDINDRKCCVLSGPPCMGKTLVCVSQSFIIMPSLSRQIIFCETKFTCHHFYVHVCHLCETNNFYMLYNNFCKNVNHLSWKHTSCYVL